MVNRWSLVLLVLGVVAGYLTFGTPVRAQNQPLPFAIGDRVTFRFAGPFTENWHNSVDCTVSDIRGVYVRCAPAPNERLDRPEQWYNQQSVVVVEKAQ
jgi:hypothetical protein